MFYLQKTLKFLNIIWPALFFSSKPEMCMQYQRMYYKKNSGRNNLDRNIK